MNRSQLNSFSVISTYLHYLYFINHKNHQKDILHQLFYCWRENLTFYFPVASVSWSEVSWVTVLLVKGSKCWGEALTWGPGRPAIPLGPGWPLTPLGPCRDNTEDRRFELSWTKLGPRTGPLSRCPGHSPVDLKHLGCPGVLDLPALLVHPAGTHGEFKKGVSVLAGVWTSTAGVPPYLPSQWASSSIWTLNSTKTIHMKKDAEVSWLT